MQILGDQSIVKASGEKEQFNEEKIVHSLASTGMSVDTASQTLDSVKKHLKPDITTQEIFGQVSGYLRDNSPKYFLNYSLKRAIMKLGPSGHPFERYIGDLLEHYGYETQVSVSLGGECVTHEIDCIATKSHETSFIECKYHNAPGTKSDVQVALYTYARFLDIEKSMKAMFNGDKTYKPWVITNTKLTYDAINYSQCMGIKTTAWSFPKKDCLHDMILGAHLHPITVIEDINPQKTQQLLERGIVTCRRLKASIDNSSTSDILTPSEVEHILEKIKLICSNE